MPSAAAVAAGKGLRVVRPKSFARRGGAGDITPIEAGRGTMDIWQVVRAQA
jgi:hypothetical protein